MPLILQLETATPTCSVAISENGHTIGVKTLAEPNVHGSKLTLFVNELLAASGKRINDLDAVAVSKGPGSYTGLRIGTSIAKGICFALDIPLIGVDTLDSMAAGFAGQERITPGMLLCPMIDARRMEVYVSVFDHQLNRIREARPVIVNEQSFDDLLVENALLFFGDGAAKCSPLFEGRSVRIVADFQHSAQSMNAIALEKYAGGDFEDLAYFEPAYLKEYFFKKKTS